MGRIKAKKLLVWTLILVPFTILLINNRSRITLPRLNINTRKTLISVVEEHHEVLKYWFEAVESSDLPRKDVHVIHIDGHSDEAIPYYYPKFPLFKRPLTKDDIETMIQGNDNFIQMSAIVGFLTSFQWIYPSWLKAEKSFSKEIRDLGFTQSLENDKIDVSFCMCGTFTGDDMKFCFAVNMTDGRYMSLPEGTCKITASYASETISENVMYNISKGIGVNTPLLPSYIKQNQYEITQKAVIWDIDLDFFGCENPGQKLVDAGFDWSTVQDLDTVLENVFCPYDIKHESQIDALLKNMLFKISRSCHLGSNQNKCQLPLAIMRKTMEKTISKYWKNVPSVFCFKNPKYFAKELINFSNHIQSLNHIQLQALIEIGFCFRTTPKTYKTILSIQICHGVNPPGTDIVQIFHPSQNDIRRRMKRLQKIFSLLPSPQLVTICRSSRDGYVPRKYAKEIEEGVIEAIKASKHSMNFQILFDSDLLGGEDGYTARYKVI